MPLDTKLWDLLHDHGVREAHLRFLARLLTTQRNGWFGFHYVHGQVRECDARLTMPSRDFEVERVSETLLGGDPHGL